MSAHAAIARPSLFKVRLNARSRAATFKKVVLSSLREEATAGAAAAALAEEGARECVREKESVGLGKKRKEKNINIM